MKLNYEQLQEVFDFLKNHQYKSAVVHRPKRKYIKYPHTYDFHKSLNQTLSSCVLIYDWTTNSWNGEEGTKIVFEALSLSSKFKFKKEIKNIKEAIQLEELCLSFWNESQVFGGE